MISCTCVVQAGQSPDRGKEKLQQSLDDFAHSSFGQRARISWIPVAPGNGYTAGGPSTSSVISISSNEPLRPERREELLRELVAPLDRRNRLHR